MPRGMVISPPQEVVEGTAVDTPDPKSSHDPAEVAGMVSHDLAGGVLGDDGLYGL